LVLSGCVAGVDGGPHPEPPDRLGPPSGGVDSGFNPNNPDHEGHGGAGGSGGAAGAVAGGAGGEGGAGGSDGGDFIPPECMDASIDAGWDDEDAGALRWRSR
jgi:hypothetical protein